MKPVVATQALALTAPGDPARDTADLQDEKRSRNRAVVPDADRDLVDCPPVAALTTLMADGSPHTTPVWCEFEAAAGRRRDAEPERQLTAVLFVDIVDATPRAVSLGDRAWAELLERYHQLVRGALERHGGWLMDTAGDGFFAIFDETADAIHCALDVRESVRELGLELRSGVHVGHCWKADEKCAGADVHVGARLASAAGPGEILISEEAQERARQAAVAVADRGLRSLKGLPGRRRVFAVGANGRSRPSARRPATP